MPGYAYRYFSLTPGKDNMPLSRCPGCLSDLTVDDAVAIELTSGDHQWEVPSSLDGSGALLDPSSEVYQGLHSQTLCSRCRQPLADFDDVLEAADNVPHVRQAVEQLLEQERAGGVTFRRALHAVLVELQRLFYAQGGRSWLGVVERAWRVAQAEEPRDGRADAEEDDGSGG